MADETNEGGIERRKFLKSAAIVAWSTPVIFTMLTQSAKAQVILCGDGSTGDPQDLCPNITTPCPSTLPICHSGPIPDGDCGCFVV